MPTLFISYKRGDSSIEPIIEKLRAAKYRIWFDKDSVVTGERWQESIDIGIEQSSAVVVMLNPEACDSQYIKVEIDTARARNRPIFPVVTRQVSAADLKKLGLESLQYIDFTRVGAWNASIERLLLDLKRKGIRVSRHDLNDLDRGSQLGRQHYLRKLRSRIGYINLSLISSGEKDIQLENVYVPLPTELAFDIEVINYNIVRWWLVKSSEQAAPENRKSDLDFAPTSILGPRVEIAALDALIDQMQEFINLGIDGKYPNAKERPLLLAPPWYDGTKRKFWPLYAVDAAAVLDRLVILGPPGSGKSTFARYLALCLLGSQLQPQLPHPNIEDLGQWPHGSLTPLYIELRQLISWNKFPTLEQPITENLFWEYITEEILGKESDEFVKELHDDLKEGRAVIILDGLDEVPTPPGESNLAQRRRQLQQLARSLDMVYPRSRIIFTSRDYGYKGWELEGFKAIRLAPFGLQLMHHLAANLYRRKELREGEAEAKANAFVNALKPIPDSLKDRPLFLTLLATIFLRDDQNRLPSSKGELYHEGIMLLLDRWTQPRLEEPSLAEQIGCNIEQLYERLEVIAFKTQEKAVAVETQPPQIDFGMLLVELFRLGDNANIQKIIAFLSQQSGVLVTPATEQYQFAHRSFQEYLAASYISRQSDFSIVRKIIEQQPLIWREVCLLIGDILARTNRRGEVWELLDALLDDSLPNELIPGDPRCWSTWLASRYALDLNVNPSNINRRDLPIYNSLRNWIKLILSTQGGLPAVERAEVGDILGKLGDDRRGVSVKDGLPDIWWCKIPAGNVQIGTTEEQIKRLQENDWAQGWTFSRETPPTDLWLPEFQISRYPITQAQFRTFADEKDSYRNPRWWTKAGWAWVQENGISGPGENDWGDHPNFPLTNTSWYEAVAFCNWLGEKLNCKIRLPMEAEWEKAARGVDGRFFPWGNDFDPSRCNAEKTGIGHVCSVGCFPLPDGPWDENSPLDMCGNVWEWCTTICEREGGEAIPYPYVPNDERENTEFGSEYLRVVRGGSYLNVPFVVRNTFRGRDKPLTRYGRHCFRIVVES